MRKLASIQSIKNIKSHPFADKLEIAEVLGWQIVVPINTYKVNDKVVFFEYDSLIPYEEKYEFLRKSSLKIVKNEECIHIRATKIRKEMSYGLVLPIESFENLENLPIGTDLTETLKIQKYEPEPSQGYLGETFGNFYSGLEKTDEPRIQVVEHLYNEMIGKPFYITEKIDGTSVTITSEIIENDVKIRIFSRNREYKQDDKKSQLMKYLTSQNILDRVKTITKQFNRNMFIQGELYGQSIQKNKLGIKGLDYRYFNIGFLDTNERLDLDFMLMLSSNELPMVKLLDFGNYFDYTIEELFKLTEGNYDGTNNQREGIVVRTQEETFLNGERLSFKVINPDYATQEV